MVMIETDAASNEGSDRLKMLSSDEELSDEDDHRSGDYMMADAVRADRNAPKFPDRMRKASMVLESEDEVVYQHRKEKSLNDAIRAVLIAGLKKNRFCRALDRSTMDIIINDMEYFEFQSGDVIMTQGEHGSRFFVIEFGKCQMRVNDKVVDTVGSGASFGGIALVYRCSRVATVIAKEVTGAWAAKGSSFRNALREYSNTHYASNRHFLDKIRLFDGMPAHRRERIGKMALLTEIYEAGKVIIRCDTEPTAVYVIKTGKVFFRSREGKRLQTLQSGDCFGWRSVLFNELESADVVVEDATELVGLGVKALRKALGDDMAAWFSQSYFLSVAKSSRLIQLVHPKIQKFVAAATATKVLSDGEELPEDVVFAAMVDGEAELTLVDGSTQTICRGERYSCAAFQELEERLGAKSESPVSKSVVSKGCRMTMIQKTAMAEAMKRVPLTVENDDPLLYLSKVMPLRKSPVFRELSIKQIDGMVAAMQEKRFPAGAEVFKQGDIADALFLIIQGGVRIVINGHEARRMGKGVCFGERALVLLEPRSGTAEALEQGVTLWSVDRKAFNEVVSESMLEKLVENLKMQAKGVSLKSLKHIRLVGVGAFGSVRLVEHKDTAFKYALKRIRKTGGGEIPPEVLQECELLSENAHPFLLKFVDKFVTNGSIYILTELVTGGSFTEQVFRKMGVLSRKQAQFYIGGVALCLQAVHRRCVIHRDVKPENIMLDNQGYIKLVDFGLAKRLTEEKPRTYTCSGTPHYMAPEVVMAQGYGTECDIWSVGVMLFELVTGDLPFGASANDVPAILNEIVDTPLDIPKRYNDLAGRKLMQSLLSKSVEGRLGVGHQGWDEIKAHKYFNQGVKGNLFAQLAGREIVAPVIPEGEDFGEEEEILEKATLSDADELGTDEPSDMGNRLEVLFRMLDLKSDGQLRREGFEALINANPAALARDHGSKGDLGHAADAPADARAKGEEQAGEVGKESPMAIPGSLSGDIVGTLVDKFMKFFDKDCDGIVTREEFIDAMLHNSAKTKLKRKLWDAFLPDGL